MSQRVVITGLGVVAPNGIGKSAFWEALTKGQSGIRQITRFNPLEFPCRIAGEVVDFDPTAYMGAKEARRMDRSAQFAVAAAKMAVEDAQLKINRQDKRLGVMIGSAVGGQGWAFEQYDIFKAKGLDKANPFTAACTFPNACSSQVSIALGITGLSETISSGCVSSSSAIGLAYDMIRQGKVNVMIVGGSEAPLNPGVFGAFCIARVLTRENGDPPSVPRPFDMRRDGIVLGEGAGILVMERLEGARKRGAHIYAEVLGWASACDAYSMMTAEPSGSEMKRTIVEALRSAGVHVEHIDLVKAHGDGSVLNDEIEAKVLKEIFGPHLDQVAITSFKSMIGHAQGASGAIEAVASTLSVVHGLVPPTINCDAPDFNWNGRPLVTGSAQARPVNKALMNAIGFGGKYVALVIGRPEE